MRVPVEVTIANVWNNQADGNHVYLIEKFLATKVAAIEALILHVLVETKP